MVELDEPFSVWEWVFVVVVKTCARHIAEMLLEVHQVLRIRHHFDVLELIVRSRLQGQCGRRDFGAVSSILIVAEMCHETIYIDCPSEGGPRRIRVVRCRSSSGGVAYHLERAVGVELDAGEGGRCVRVIQVADIVVQLVGSSFVCDLQFERLSAVQSNEQLVLEVQQCCSEN